jgi:hypothetical protein
MRHDAEQFELGFPSPAGRRRPFRQTEFPLRIATTRKKQRAAFLEFKRFVELLRSQTGRAKRI